MTIDIKKSNNSILVSVAGRLDTTTAPSLEAELNTAIGDNAELILDFAELEYISSAGLRVILTTQKIMNKQGKMIIKNVNADVMEVFEITGFTDILTIE